MSTDFDLQQIQTHIRTLRRAAERLAAFGEDFPALEKNARRILAGVKMLQINVSDLLEPEE